ncbi:MAG: hypothetical protein HKP01_04880 [Gemmatimonadetes bacterium]|nr:hypothetical protein [Gemmatimonadota bacterium]
MASRTDLRLALGVLTGLWVTVGAAVPVGYVVLRALKRANGGTLGPELLEGPGVVLTLLAAYGVAAAIGGWAAGWVAIENRRILTALLATLHAGTSLFVVAAELSPLEPGITLSLAAAAVLGTIAGVSVRAWQVGRWSRTAMAE